MILHKTNKKGSAYTPIRKEVIKVSKLILIMN